MKIYIKAAIIDIATEDYDTQYELAHDPNTSPEVLAQLSESSADQIVNIVLQNPSTPVETLKKFVDIPVHSYKYDRTKAELAMINPNMPVSVLSDIDRYPHLLNIIALNESTPVDTLLQLIELGKSNNHYSNLLGCISCNPNAPEDFLESIVRNNSWRECCLLASNIKLPYSIQKELSEHLNCWIREILASNPGVSMDILKKLAQDSERTVSNAAKRNLDKRGKHNEEIH